MLLSLWYQTDFYQKDDPFLAQHTIAPRAWESPITTLYSTFQEDSGVWKPIRL